MYLNCRATNPKFVIPYQKYITSITNPICVGMRFKMRFDRDDSPDRRYTKLALDFQNYYKKSDLHPLLLLCSDCILLSSVGSAEVRAW